MPPKVRPATARPPSARTSGRQLTCLPSGAQTKETPTDAAATEAPSKRIKWTRERDTALLTQVIAVGVKAFATSKANKKDTAEEDKYNQGETWSGADGILTMLKKHEAFETVTWPSYQSVINHITGDAGLLKKYEHLYKQGKEQDEPAEAGTDATKDESALGVFEQAIIEVAELYKEAKAMESGAREAKKADELNSAEAKEMQDAAVKKKYGAMSAAELAGSRAARKKKRMEEHSSDEQSSGDDSEVEEVQPARAPARTSPRARRVVASPPPLYIRNSQSESG